MYIDSVISKLENKQAVVGIIGLGYVGLPLALCFVEKGFRTIGFDIDQSKVDFLHTSKSYIKHISEKRIQRAKKTGLFDSTTDFSKLPECDAILIAVPTPLSKNREPEWSKQKAEGRRQKAVGSKQKPQTLNSGPLHRAEEVPLYGSDS